jgi:predicted nucleic acid-binding protein
MSDVVIDTCCLINCCAAEPLDKWLPALELTWYVPRTVRSEALYLRPAEPDTDELIDEPIDLTDWINSGIIRECDAEGKAELALYLELAAQLDDGEALALAIAQHRGWVLATDDRKARRMADERGVHVLTTPAILKCWADEVSASVDEIAERIRRVTVRARFTPPKNDPLHAWWRRLAARPAKS